MFSALAGVYPTFLFLSLIFISFPLFFLMSFISQYYLFTTIRVFFPSLFLLLSFSSSFSVIIRLDLPPLTTGPQFNFVVEFHILSSFHVPFWLLCSLVTLHSTSHPFTFPLLYFNTPLHFCPPRNAHALWFYPLILSTFHTATSHILSLCTRPRLSSSLLPRCQGTARANCAPHEKKERNNQSRL